MLTSVHVRARFQVPGSWGGFFEKSNPNPNPNPNQVLALDEYSQLDVVDTQLLGVRYDEVGEKLKIELEEYECPRMRVKGGREHLQSASRKKLRRTSLGVVAVEALSTCGSERRKSASEAPADRTKSIPPKRQIQYSEV